MSSNTAESLYFRVLAIFFRRVCAFSLHCLYLNRMKFNLAHFFLIYALKTLFADSIFNLRKLFIIFIIFPEINFWMALSANWVDAYCLTKKTLIKRLNILFRQIAYQKLQSVGESVLFFVFTESLLFCFLSLFANIAFELSLE